MISQEKKYLKQQGSCIRMQNEYYMVGDSVNADIIGGNQAGFKTILVHKGFNEQADYCFEDLQAITDLF